MIKKGIILAAAMLSLAVIMSCSMSSTDLIVAYEITGTSETADVAITSKYTSSSSYKNYSYTFEDVDLPWEFSNEEDLVAGDWIQVIVTNPDGTGSITAKIYTKDGYNSTAYTLLTEGTSTGGTVTLTDTFPSSTTY